MEKRNLTIVIEKHSELENTYIAHFEGSFDGSIKELFTELEDLIQKSSEKTNVVFDFQKLTYLNSYAIGLLVAWHNHLAKTKGQIIIAAPSKNVEDILGILGISNLFKIFPAVNSALEALKRD